MLVLVARGANAVPFGTILSLWGDPLKEDSKTLYQNDGNLSGYKFYNSHTSRISLSFEVMK